MALSATFLGQSLYHRVALNWLYATWSSLGMSVLLGTFSFGKYISDLSEGAQPKPRQGPMEALSALQFLFLLAGFVFLGVFAVQNANHQVATSHHAPRSTQVEIHVRYYQCCCRRHGHSAIDRDDKSRAWQQARRDP